MHSDFPHYLTHIHSPSPHTAMPSSPNAGCHLNSDHKHNSWGKGKQKPQRHHRELLNICKQPAQESQPTPAPSVKDSGQRQPRSASLTTGKHRFLPRRARSQLGFAHLPEAAGRCAAGGGRWWMRLKHREKANSGAVGCMHGTRASRVAFLLLKAALKVNAIEQL